MSPLRALPSFGQVENIGFARDGEMLVIQSFDGAVNLWDVEASDSIWVLTSEDIVRLPLDETVWHQRAFEAAGRDLTQDEWDRLVPGGGPVQSACT